MGSPSVRAMILLFCGCGGLWASTESVGPRCWSEAVWDACQSDDASPGQDLDKAFPVQSDWILQDLGGAGGRSLLDMADEERVQVLWRATWKAKAFGDGDSPGLPLRPRGLKAALRLYERTAERRRKARLDWLRQRCPRVVFTKHQILGGSHYAYTEGQSDAQGERHFAPGASLCLLDLNGPEPRVEVLLEDPGGVIRDPDVSFDGSKILFSWKKSLDEDDYHLYEMDATTGETRAITSGLGAADTEGIYLPDGRILFNSTRCVQTVDCWWTEVSNLYACDKDGGRMRRLSFDQVHTNFPTLMEDGRVIYTRWDYNDRGQIFPQGLFQMHQDGAGQTELYGNNSWFPTSILHGRGIPGTQKVVAILSGHHSRQMGKLAIIDPAMGRQENAGVQLIAPVRATDPVRVDAYGQTGELFQYPYPLSETEFLVAFSPRGAQAGEPLFGIYLMRIDGQRELLAWDPVISVGQPVPLVRREEMCVRPTRSADLDAPGIFYVSDIAAGPGLKGIPRQEVCRLRVVALEYRPAGLGKNVSRGPAGGALSSTPVSIGNGCWDVKIVLGETEVYGDGSAFFRAPSRTPVYFQALNEKGHVVQTMRSWSTLQPGETFSCVGCHESKNSSPAATGKVTEAMRRGPQDLHPFYSPARGFSFPEEIQPILDRRCIQCHRDRTIKAPGARSEADAVGGFSLLGEQTVEEVSKRRWSDSYLALTGATISDGCLQGRPGPLVNWITTQSEPSMLPPYSAGAARSGLLDMLGKGHKGVDLTQEEMDKLACWIDLGVPFCGDYREANAWTTEEAQTYDRFLLKRQRMAEMEISSWASRLP